MALMTSCGKNQTNKSKGSEGQNSREDSQYGLPVVGFQRSVDLNYRLEHSYENLSFNPSGKRDVLGDRPFFLFLNEDNSIELRFYSKIDLKTVAYLDLGNKFETTQNKSFSEISNHPNYKKMNDYFRHFTYGSPNLDSPQQDMLNKIFVIETEESDQPYSGKAKIMFWVECQGGFNFKDKHNYHCGHGKLVFNYKLLDYTLTK